MWCDTEFYNRTNDSTNTLVYLFADLGGNFGTLKLPNKYISDII